VRDHRGVLTFPGGVRLCDFVFFNWCFWVLMSLFASGNSCGCERDRRSHPPAPIVRDGLVPVERFDTDMFVTFVASLQYHCPSVPCGCSGSFCSFCFSARSPANPVSWGALATPGRPSPQALLAVGPLDRALVVRRHGSDVHVPVRPASSLVERGKKIKNRWYFVLWACDQHLAQ